MRVAQVIEGLDSQSGGTTTAFLGIMAALHDPGAGVEARAFAPRPADADPVWDAVRADPDPSRWTFTGPSGRLIFPGDTARAVGAELKAGRLDLVHLHGVWSPDLVAVSRAAARAGVPCVWHAHGMLIGRAMRRRPLKKQLFLAAGLRAALNRAGAIIYTTDEERETSVSPGRVPRAALEVVPLPVEVPEPLDRSALSARGRARFGLPPGVPVIAFMGRLHQVKRLELTIRSFVHAARVDPGVRLLIMGSGLPGYDALLKDIARLVGVGDRVVFAGWVSGEDRALGLAAADAMVLNSQFENFGYVVVEALGVGTPVVLTENLAIAEEVRRIGAGWVAAPNPDALGDALLQAVKASAHAPGGGAAPAGPEMGRRGREWVVRRFSHGAIARRLAGVYHAAIARAGSGAVTRARARGATADIPSPPPSPPA